MDDIAPTADFGNYCPSCVKEFSSIEESDGARTYLSCGHSVCFKCIQTEWCKSVSNDVDIVNCPLCQVEVLICFDRQSQGGNEMSGLPDGGSTLTHTGLPDVAPPPQLHHPTPPPPSPAPPSTSQKAQGCSDVLICQQMSTDHSASEVFPEIPLSVTNSYIEMAELGGHVIDFHDPTQITESAADRSWSMDIMNIHEMLEKNNASQHIAQDCLFNENSESDMGSVQDILKIANIQGDSLLDDNSLSAIFQDNSNDRIYQSENLQNPMSSSDINELSRMVDPSAVIHPGKRQENLQQTHHVSMEDVNSQINNALQIHKNNFEHISDEHRILLERLESETELIRSNRRNQRSGGRRSYGGRGGRRRKQNLYEYMSDDVINAETLAAVATIQDQSQTLSPGNLRQEKVRSLKENLHDRFYPKTRGKHLLQGHSTRRGRTYNKRVRRDDIEIRDMQMVKIVSDLKLPEPKMPKKIEPVTPVDKTSANYGYVKNALLPNGNEIKNLYVVPQTWLNNDEVEVQFTPSSEKNTSLTASNSNPGTPIQEPFLCNTPPPLQSHTPDQQVMSTFATPTLGAIYNPTTTMSVSQPETFIDYPIVTSQTVHPKKVSTKKVKSVKGKTQDDNIKTTFAKSLIDNTHKIIKVWSKDKDGERDSPKEVRIAKLPPPDELEMNDNFETEMLHVRYEINNDQIVFMPDGDTSTKYSESNLETLNEGGEPLLIITVNKSDSNKGDSAESHCEVKERGEEFKVQSAISQLELSDKICVETIAANSISGSEEGGCQSRPPTACNSAVSIQGMFSSPDSVRADDLQEWYRSGDTSRELELEPWGSEAGKDPEEGKDMGGARCEEILVDVHNSGSELHCDVHFSIPLDAEKSEQTTNLSTPAVCEGSNVNSETLEGIDYGSPPQLERMSPVSTQEGSIVSAISETFSQHPSEDNGSFKTDARGVTNCKNSGYLGEIMNSFGQLNDLETIGTTSLNITELLSQLSKVKSFCVEVDIDNEEKTNLVDLILDQVSSLIACVNSESLLKMKARVLNSKLQDSLSRQREHLVNVFESGLSLVVSLVDEFNMSLLKSSNSTDENDSRVTMEVERFDPEQSPKGDIPSNHKDSEYQDNDIPEVETDCVLNEHCDVEDRSSVSDDNVDSCASELVTQTSDNNTHEVQSDQVEKSNIDMDFDTGDKYVKPKVSDIALNVEIASVSRESVAMDVDRESESFESVLPSLSEVLRESNVSSDNHRATDTQSVQRPAEERVSTLDLDDAEDDDVKDSDYEYESEDNDEDWDEDENRRPPCRTPVKRSATARRPESSRSLTPRKRRGGVSQGASTPSKLNRAGKKTARRRKKTKDIYASSSEEIIPTFVKRGFQYTDDCFKVFNAVYNHRRSDPFCKEIRSADVPGYYKVVKRAMWLDLIAMKLRTGRYDCLMNFVDDMRLVFENSRRFNKHGSQLYESGLICEKLFEEKLREQFPHLHL